MEKDGVIELDKKSVSMFMTCIKHAIRMTGRFHPHSWQTQRASAPKDQPTFDILANEEFTDTERQLFGPAFEQRLKTRSETAEISGKAKVGKPFFRGAASRGSLKPRGDRMWNTFQSF